MRHRPITAGEQQIITCSCCKCVRTCVCVQLFILCVCVCVCLCVCRESSLSSMRGILKLDSMEPATSGSDIYQVRDET